MDTSTPDAKVEAPAEIFIPAEDLWAPMTGVDRAGDGAASGDLNPAIHYVVHEFL